MEKETLKVIGLSKPHLLRWSRSEIVLFLLFLTIALLSIRLNLLPVELKGLPQALAIISSIIAFTFGYLQWRAARHEVSFDRYFDKLDTANKRFDAWRIEALKDNAEELQDHLNTMFIFAELDNLEYILEKYKLGYVRQNLAERAIRAFRSRCVDTDFRNRAIYWVGTGEGEEIAKAYHKDNERGREGYHTENSKRQGWALDDTTQVAYCTGRYGPHSFFALTSTPVNLNR